MAAAWLVIAAIVGVVVGRVIRERDRQVPPAPEARPAFDPDTGASRRVAGRGRPRRR